MSHLIPIAIAVVAGLLMTRVFKKLHLNLPDVTAFLIAGLLIGLIGHALIDFSYGWGIWWSWVIASGVFGLLVGLSAKLLKMNEAEMGKKGLIKFNIAQVVGHIICWGAVAPILDILMYNEPLEKLFSQGLMAGIGNSVTTAIIGSLLCVAYAATKTKAGSLTKE